MPLFIIVVGGIIAAVGAILALGFELRIGLYITIFGTSIIVTEFIIDEWRICKKIKEKKDEE